MNREKLRKLLDSLKAAIDEIQPELEKPVDTFVLHIYRARRQYDLDAGRKGGKRADETFQRTYMRARELGFHGDAQAWRYVLKAFPPASPGDDAQT